MPKARIKWRLCGQRPAFQASVPTVGDIPHYSKVKVPSHISDGRAFYPVLTSPITANAPGNEAIFKPKLVVRLSLYENYCFDVMWRYEGSGEVSFKQSKSKEEEGVFLNTSLVFIRWSIAWNSTNSINAMHCNGPTLVTVVPLKAASHCYPKHQSPWCSVNSVQVADYNSIWQCNWWIGAAVNSTRVLGQRPQLNLSIGPLQ